MKPHFPLRPSKTDYIHYAIVFYRLCGGDTSPLLFGDCGALSPGAGACSTQPNIKMPIRAAARVGANGTRLPSGPIALTIPILTTLAWMRANTRRKIVNGSAQA